MKSEPKPPFPEQHQKTPGIEAELTPRPRYLAAGYKPAGKLGGKAALITGGDSGIGRAVAVIYAREGADVAGTPYQRPAQPEEIAPAYVFFASNADSSYITGVILPEMGGAPLAA